MSTNLNRFIEAHENSFDAAFQELKNGRKTSHWMWFIFPQIKGLGKSEIARKFEIQDADEAVQYLQHEILGPRILQLSSILVYEIHGKSAEEIFGFPDWLKLHSSMTLFYLTVKRNPDLFAVKEFSIFKKVLDKYYDGKFDQNTVDRF